MWRVVVALGWETTIVMLCPVRVVDESGLDDEITHDRVVAPSSRLEGGGAVTAAFRSLCRRAAGAPGGHRAGTSGRVLTSAPSTYRRIGLLDHVRDALDGTETDPLLPRRLSQMASSRCWPACGSTTRSTQTRRLQTWPTGSIRKPHEATRRHRDNSPSEHTRWLMAVDFYGRQSNMSC